uniref:Transposase IS200-like domain-containing protein n=1 Tax=uncultured Armatimonadetes bacterium TaxID=157466 RepID=A0A6J4JG38_9BACT|nr:hypothetical protein AVDCRST_MAG63-3396 [uncultured Armatimonadetes bacterium]
MTAPARLHYHLLWPVRGGAAGSVLTPEALDLLPSYVARYAQTLGTTVGAVGGRGDHLHVVADVPPDRQLAKVNEELRRAAARFLRATLSIGGFDWDDAAQVLSTVSSAERPDLIQYVLEQEARHAEGGLFPEWEGGEDFEAGAGAEAAMPDWLREVLPRI